jgi:hypothetical protein
LSPKRLFHSSLACFATLFLVFVDIASAAAVPQRAEIDAIMSRLSAITGMPVRHKLRFRSINRKELSDYLQDRAAESVSPRELELEQIALELLGFVPHNFDLRQTTLDLLTEQAAAFYDYHRKALYISDWTPDSMRDSTVVHELSHALADQSFNLDKYARKVENDSEKSAAREAVVEGQASYLMLAYDASVKGDPPLEADPDTSQFADAAAPTGDFPVFDKAPLYIRETMIFPYTWGMAFQSAVIHRFGQSGFSKVFRDPPVSTHQILHPEAYFSGEKPVDLRLPDPPRHSKGIYGGVLGELDHRILIEQFVSKETAERLSRFLRGSSFGVYQTKRPLNQTLVYVSEWASEDAAREFLEVYRKCLKGKSTGMRLEQAGDDFFAGTTDGGHFRVARTGRRVTSIENSPHH